MLALGDPTERRPETLLLDNGALRDPRLVVGVGTEEDRAPRTTDRELTVRAFVDGNLVAPLEA